MQKFTRRLFVASALALSVASAGVAKAEDKILASVPGLTLPLLRPHDERLQGGSRQAGLEA